MSVIFNIVLPILAVISIIGVFIFLIRAVAARSSVSNQAYEVGRVETRQKAQANLLRALISLFFAIIFLAILLIGPRLAAMFPSPTPTPVPATVVPTKAPTATTAATQVPPRQEPTATSPLPTATVTPLPTETATPQPPTATVSSGVGIYLRSSPSVAGVELEYLEDGTTLLIMPGQETADELQWQQVATDSGVIGWVAADFITVDQP